MTTYSRADLRKDVLVRLGVTPIGDDPSAEEASTVDATLSQMFEQLDEEGLVNFNYTSSVSTQAIPGKLMNGYVLMGEFLCAQRFGAQRDFAQYQEGQRLLRRALRPNADSSPTKAEYF